MKRFKVYLNGKCIKSFETHGGAHEFVSKKILEMSEKDELVLFDSQFDLFEFKIYKY